MIYGSFINPHEEELASVYFVAEFFLRLVLCPLVPGSKTRAPSPKKNKNRPHVEEKAKKE